MRLEAYGFFGLCEGHRIDSETGCWWLVQYANGGLESFRKLLTACMCCSGLVGSESLVFGDDAESLWKVVGAGNRGRGIITIVINHNMTRRARVSTSAAM